MSEPVTITLSQPIEVVGEQRHELILRPPDGGMLMRAGAYVRIIHLDSGDSAIEPLPSGIGKLIAACARIPVRSVEFLAAPDFAEAQGVILGFLAPSAKSPSTATLKPPIGGESPVISSA